LVSITIDWEEKVEGCETIKTWGQIEGHDGERIESYELGVNTIQMLGVKQEPKDYLVSFTVYNKGQFDNYAIMHVYTFSDEDPHINQASVYEDIELGFECVGEC